MSQATSVTVYSKAKEGGQSVSTHFKVKEFACNDGSDPVWISSSLVSLLEQVRNYFDKPVVINSGYRTPAYNKKIGGATYSQHCYGTAADIHITGVLPKTIYSYLNSKYPNTLGLGLYSSFVHVDVRKAKSRWNG